VDHRVAIIGAGWAGLAAAVTLAEHGTPVVVFEASRSLGGRARRVAIEGLDLDNGQHILIGAYAETLRLVRMVGLDPARVFRRLPLELRSSAGFRLRTPNLPAPWHLLVGLLVAKGVDLASRLAATRLLAAHRRRRYRLPQDETVQAWLSRNGQPPAIQQALWEPLCTSALNTPVARASAQVFLNVLRDTAEGERGASDLLLPRIDLSALFPEPAARLVESRGGAIRLGAAVRRIERESEGFRLDPGHERFSAVIVACAPQHADPLLGPIAGLEDVVAQIARFEYEPIHTCYLQYPERISLPFPMIGGDGGLAQWTFDRGALSGHAGLVACVLSGSGAHEALGQSELVAGLHAELARTLPGLVPPHWAKVIAEKRATFSCQPGLRRPANATPVPNLFLAGDYTASDYPATLEAAMRSGVAAATLALAAR
jgi:squalene-associated FAD-dependent desaturase